MTKTEMVRYLSAEAGINNKQGAAVLNALSELAVKTLKKGDKLAIPGFVTVKVQNRKARMGRNPQTGEAIKIPAKKVVKAVPSAALKGILGPKKK